MKKAIRALVALILGATGMYLLILQPSLGIRNRLDLLQQEEYTHGCKASADQAVASTTPKPPVSESDQRKRRAMQQQQLDKEKAQTGINCPDADSRANLIAIDGLRMSSFSGIVAYLLGFGSLLSIWIAYRDVVGSVGSRTCDARAFLGLGTSTTGPDHATLMITNVGDAAVWLRSVTVNDDPAVFGGIGGGILLLRAGRSHGIGTRVRHPLGGIRSTIQIGYSQVGSVPRTMTASIVNLHGNWDIEDVQYHDG